MIDFRALCAELLSVFDSYDDESNLAGIFDDMKANKNDLLERARAALAEPEPEVGPTDEELLELWHGSDWFDEGATLGEFRSIARAVLARWGHQLAPLAEVGCPACEGVPKPGNQPCAVCGRPAPVPAEGEVAELVARLRRASDGASAMGWEQDSWIIARAADLLSQRHPAPVLVCERDLDSILSPSGGYELREGAALTEGAQLIGGEWWAPVFGCDSVESALNRIRQRLDPFQQNGKLKSYQAIAPLPVPVAERLPGPEDCDGEGRAWFLSFPFEYNRMIWSLEDRTYGCNTGFTHWLPATALPLPQGKVQP